MDELMYPGNQVVQTTNDFGQQALVYAEIWGPRVIGSAVVIARFVSKAIAASGGEISASWRAGCH